MAASVSWTGSRCLGRPRSYPGSQSGIIIANNALYCSATTAVDWGGSTSGITMNNNYVEGALKGAASIDNDQFFSGGTAAAAFANSAIPPTTADFYPAVGSPLIGNADPTHAPADDFNGTVRVGPDDAGAYDTNGLATNPGWPIGPGFKSGEPPASTSPAPPVGLTIR